MTPEQARLLKTGDKVTIQHPSEGPLTGTFEDCTGLIHIKVPPKRVIIVSPNLVTKAEEEPQP